MNEILPTLLDEFRETIKLDSEITPRNFTFPSAKNMIKVAVGMRRSGKTYFLFQTIRQFLDKKFPIERILYINFEDDRLLPLDSKGMGSLIDHWYTLYPENHNQQCYIFLDEVQNVEGWATVLRRLLDTKNLQIYATGSSAKLLSKEIATSLRGRSLSIEILPYDFSEYLISHHQKQPTKPFGKKTLDSQRKNLLKFLEIGGFPGIQMMNHQEQLETLQNYVETVIFRDVVERHQISNITLLKYFIQFLLKGVAAPFSINKFYNDIKSQGFKAGKDTLHAYLSYLEDAFLLFTVPIFTESLRHSQTSTKKIYAIDNGLIRANTFNLSDNLGKLFENQVYIDLRRQGKKIFYYKTSEGFEIDFITQDIKGNHEIIQVAFDIDDPKTIEREKRALEAAEKELGFKGKLIDWKSYIQEFQYHADNR